MKLNRRALLVASATAAVSAADCCRQVLAQSNSAKVDLRGHDGILERLPRLDLESYQDFLRQFRVFTRGDYLTVAGTRAYEILKMHGIDRNAVVPLETVLPLFATDPIITSRLRALVDEQHYAFKTLSDAFHSKADAYLAELESADTAGPGTLELNPELHIPEYCKLEFNGQPGGYCGDPFAGYIYHYYTLSLAEGEDTEASNPQDHDRDTIAAAVAVPSDGKVRRILDIGTGPGQLATSLKKRFPDAEVWGIDSAGPMVRYAHMRANDMHVGVHFAQRLAEDSRFPDGHFDVVASNLLLHEVTADASRKIFKEVARILRASGTYYPHDMYASSPPRQPGQGFNGWLTFRLWVNYRWAYEPWLMEWYNLDFRDAMRAVGFRVSDDGKRPGGGAGFNVVGVKS